ncbi:MAG: hypothetical protein ACK4OP_04780 [Gemmobacter sp.]
MFRHFAFVALVLVAAPLAIPGAAAVPTASGTAVLMPAGAHASGVSASFDMPVAEVAPPAPLPAIKTVRDNSCL